MDSFDNIPLSAIVNGKFIAVHGGISPELNKVEQINKINRFQEPPKDGLLCDLLWADPVDNDEGKTHGEYVFNEVRGCSWTYGADAANNFLDRNSLLTIIRAHEAQIEGFKMHKWNSTDFPLVITIFSAPNYCDTYNNKGAVIKFNNNTLNIQQFNYSRHPYMLPNFMDVFTWSIPFVAEKVIEMFYHIIKTEEDDTNLDNVKVPELNENKNSHLPKKTEILRNKVNSIAKLLKMQRVLRENSEDIIQIKSKANNHKLPVGI